MNRVDRLHAILIQLQSRKIVKAKEIADRFNISLRTVYRDVHALEESGVPVIGEAGTGYSIMEGYRLPPVMFTREEATAFLMAEKLLEKYSDEYNASIFRSAMFKVKAVLRSTEKDFLSSIENNIAVLKTQNAPGEEQASLQKILTAINEKKLLQIQYEGAYATEKTTRKVEPVGIFLQNSYWYLIAFCRLRNDYRNFKISRIISQFVTDETFEKQHAPFEDFLQRTTREQQMQQVILRVKKEAARFIITEKYYYGFVTEKMVDDGIEMTFLSSSLRGMARWIMMFADYAEIVEPAALKTEILNIIEAAQKKFS